MTLTADQILAANDIRTEEVHVPEWGGTVIVRGLSGAERDAFESDIFDTPPGKGPKRDNVRAKLVAATLVDANGGLLFRPTQIALLGRKSAIALDRVYEVAQRLSGFGKADIEVLEKNSGAGPSDDSGSN